MNLVLSSGALRDISTACTASQGLETGGLLLSSQPDASTAVAEWIEGPGPEAAAERQRLVWDPSFIAGLLVGLEYSEVRAIGRWHKHVTPNLRASDDDRAGADALRLALGREWVVDLIVATGNGDHPIAMAAYLCTGQGYSEIPCPEPPGRVLSGGAL